MSEHLHYVVVWEREIEERDGQERDDADTRVEVFHDADQARDRWGALYDAGVGCMLTTVRPAAPASVG